MFLRVEAAFETQFVTVPSILSRLRIIVFLRSTEDQRQASLAGSITTEFIPMTGELSSVLVPFLLKDGEAVKVVPAKLHQLASLSAAIALPSKSLRQTTAPMLI